MPKRLLSWVLLGGSIGDENLLTCIPLTLVYVYAGREDSNGLLSCPRQWAFCVFPCQYVISRDFQRLKVLHFYFYFGKEYICLTYYCFLAPCKAGGIWRCSCMCVFSPYCSSVERLCCNSYEAYEIICLNLYLSKFHDVFSSFLWEGQ